MNHAEHKYTPSASLDNIADQLANSYCTSDIELRELHAGTYAVYVKAVLIKQVWVSRRKGIFKVYVEQR